MLPFLVFCRENAPLVGLVAFAYAFKIGDRKPSSVLSLLVKKFFV